MNRGLLRVRLLAWAGIGLSLMAARALVAQGQPQPAPPLPADQPDRTIRSSSRSSGARSARPTWAAASTTSRSSKATRASSTWGSRRAASGRRTNNGTTWTPLFDSYPVSSIGDIAIAPSNPDIIYVGTGEPNNRQSSSFGAGVYKSTDAGKTLRPTSASRKRRPSRASSSHPKDPNIVYVAAVGHLFGPNPERGLYKTTDGGKTWTNTKFIDNDTGFTDVVMDPSNPNVLFAASYQRRRAAVGLQRRRAGQRHLENDRRGEDLDEADGQRPARQSDHRPHRPRHRALEAVDDLRVDRSRPERRHRRGRERRRDAGGAGAGRRRRRRTRTGPASARSEQERRLALRRRRQDVEVPVEPRRSLDVLQQDPRRSDQPGDRVPGRRAVLQDGRRRQDVAAPSTASRTAITTRSGSTRANNNHLLRRQRRRPRRHLRPGRDVGVRQHDGGSASSTRSAPTCGSRTTSAAGCRTTAAGAARARCAAANGILNSDWYRIGGGDGFYTQNDPTDWTTVYSESQDGEHEPARSADRQQHQHPAARAGWPRRRRRAGGEPGDAGPGAASRFRRRQAANVVPAAAAGHELSLLLEHAVHPVAAQPAHDLPRRRSAVPVVRPRRHLDGVAGSDEQHRPQRSADHGRRRHRADGVEARRRRVVQQHRHDQRIAARARASLWVGTNDGNVQVSRDGGHTWKNVVDKVPGVPKETHVSRVEASHFDAGTAYVTFDGHRTDDHKPYVFVTTDFGETWTSISANLPEGQRQRDPRRSEEPEPAVSRHRVRLLRLAERRARVEAVHERVCRRCASTT